MRFLRNLLGRRNEENPPAATEATQERPESGGDTVTIPVRKCSIGKPMTIPEYRQLVDVLGVSLYSDEFRRVTQDLGQSITQSDPGYNTHVSYPGAGLSFVFEQDGNEWSCESIFIYPGGIEGFSRYPHEVEDGLEVSATRSDVHSTLGAPSVSSVLVDYHWDVYDRKVHCINFQYDSEHGAVRLMTLMTRGAYLSYGGSN